MAEGIAYQRNDILLKVLSENYKNKSLKVYGLDLPPIKKILPTNLPAIMVNEKRTDNAFELMDESILLLEYESSPHYSDLIKYAHYGFRTSENYSKSKLRKVHLVVIYTADVETAPSTLDLGSIQLKFSQVFLSKFDDQKMYQDLKKKVKNNETLLDEDIMKFIILPLTKKHDKQKFLEETIELAKEVKDEGKKSFIVAGMITAAYKFIDKKYLNNIWEWIKMTELARLFEEEKVDAVNRAIKEKEEEKIIALKEKNKQFVYNLLNMNMDILNIMKATGLTKAEILDLKKELMIESEEGN